ncbi:MAG TPA: hypothetical protein VH115_05370 [Solirubrobacteraceae bacterium]|nr:hypothetical protein [Solirubrobacteraceae bacterium]
MSTALVVIVAVAATVLLALSPAVWRTLRDRLHGPPPAVIVATRSTTSHDWTTCAVQSVQTAEIEMTIASLDEIWSARNLERLARTYWRFLSRATLGLVRVSYRKSGRAIVLIARPLTLISFHPPEYELSQERGIVRWRIAGGLLVARRRITAGGHLQIEVRREGITPDGRARLLVEVAVRNFYPSIATRISRRLYDATQSRIHVIITKAFLRSLVRLDLAESRVGRFRVRPLGGT